MVFLKKLFKMKQWSKDGFESIGWNILGNLLPIWVLVLIAITNNGFNWIKIYEAMHQPFTLLVLSGTYLTSTFYIVSKGKVKNKIFPFIFTILLLLIGFLITDKKNLENLSANFYTEITVVLIFISTLSLYIYHQFKYYYNKYNISQEEERDNQYNEMDDKFDNL